MRLKRTYRLKGILIFFCSVLIISFIGITSTYSYYFFRESMTRKLAESRIDVLNQVADKVLGIYENAFIIGNFYFYNQIAEDVYKQNEFTDNEKDLIIKNLKDIDLMSQETKRAANVDYEYVLVMNNHFSYASNGESGNYSFEQYRKCLWYLDLTENKNSFMWVSTYKDYDKNGTYVTSIVRALLDKENNIIGLFLLNLPEEYIYNTYKQLLHKNSIYIVDKSGNIVSHSNKDMLSVNFYDMDIFNTIFENSKSGNIYDSYKIITKNKEKFLFSKLYSSVNGWTFVEEIPLNVVLADVNYLRNNLLIAAVVCILLAIVIIIYISDKTTRPLNVLVSQMEQTGHSIDENTVFKVSGWSEINKICDECNFMNQRIHNLIQEVQLTEREKRKAELGFMQAQMSPHFMYNTLFSIKCLVDMNDKKGAIDTINSFTAILKYILSYKSEFVTIAEEIVLLEDYTKLQKVLYGDKFNIRIHCDQELYDSKILRMILQPLVENSLLHGIADDKTKVSVNVNFIKKGEDIHIEIIDDGVGFNNINLERLYKRTDKIYDLTKPEKKNPSNMIGLNNIRSRIKNTFGKDYGLKIDVKYTGGAKLIVIVPNIS